ncbi:MAG: cell division protein FtsX [Myxococcota bacterium]
MSWHTLPTTLRQVRRNFRQGRGPFLFATVMIALGTFGMSTYLAVLSGLDKLVGHIDDSAGIVLFLSNVDLVEAEEVRAQVHQSPGVASAQLVSPDEIVRGLRSTLSGSELALLEQSGGIGLGWALHVRVDDDHVNQLPELSSSLSKLPGVEEAAHPGADLAHLRALENGLWGIAWFIGVLLAGVSVLVIHHTAKLTLYARRDELTLLKLVGATDTFIRVPLVIVGGLQGLCGTLSALMALSLSQHALTLYIARLFEGIAPPPTISSLSPMLSLCLVTSGIAIGMASASFSLERFLRV